MNQINQDYMPPGPLNGPNPVQQALLEKPFRVEEHGFKNGQPYILKSAIRRRLNQVDPGWRLSGVHHVATINDVVLMAGALSVCGASREDVGSGIVQSQKKSGAKTLDVTGYELARETSKAFKTAVSDLLPRCALQFGVGWYMKALPKHVRDEASLAQYLAALDRQAQRDPFPREAPHPSNESQEPREPHEPSVQPAQPAAASEPASEPSPQPAPQTAPPAPQPTAQTTPVADPPATPKGTRRTIPKSWIENPGAKEAVTKRLAALGVNGLDHAERLINRSAREFGGIESFVKSVAQAWEKARQEEPA